jgi:PAS domain S-box-containing protein
MHRISQQTSALLLAGIYALAGFLWIFLSDQLSIHYAQDAYELNQFQTYKGWAFIVVTTLLVFALIRAAQFHRARHEEKTRRMQSVQKVLSDVSQAIIKTRDMSELFRQVCRISAEEGGFQLVWIGRVDATHNRISMAATAGGDAQFVDAIDLFLDPGHPNACPMAATLLKGEFFICADFKQSPCQAEWKKMALARNYRSVLALPIKIQNELGGAIAFYSDQPYAFEQVELQLLETLAGDLSMALSHSEDEQRWIMALEGAGHGVWDANLATKKVFFSRQWKAHLGYAEHEIGNDMTEWSSRIHPEDAKMCLDQVEKVESGEITNIDLTYRLRCKDGTYKWILAKGMVFGRDADGQAQRLVGTDTDITESKNRERAFFEAQKAAHIGSYIYDVRQDAWTSTPVMDEIFGIDATYPKDVGSWISLIRPDHREQMRDYLHDALHQRQLFDKDYPIMRRNDGAERWVHGLGEVELDEQGAPLRLVGTIQDITERRKNNLILHGRLALSTLAQEGRIVDLLRTALDMAEDMTGSTIGFFHFVNHDQETLTLQAWSSNTLANMCTAEGFDTHYPISKAGVWADCVRRREPVIHNNYSALPNRKGMPNGHAEVLRELTVPVIRQGSVVAIAGIGNKTTDYTGGDAAILQELAGFVMDLVSNIEAEKSLRQSEMQLRKTTENLQSAVDNLTLLNTELERFAFIASHDLQEPLRNITTYTQLIDRKFRDKVGPEGKEYFDLVVGGAKRMYALINDLLTYSRTGINTHPPHLISSAQACKAAIENLFSAVKESGVEIIIGDLPSVIAEEVQVMQLFQQLISNAIKFRHPQRKPRVSVSAVRTDGFWEFQVGDNGIGFDPQEQDVFELFRRVHSTRGYGGTGVGLAICRRIVLRNGGRIWVESEIGKGSVFHFTLPASPDEMPTA